MLNKDSFEKYNTMDNCIFAGSLADKYTEKLQTGEIESINNAIYGACLDMAEAKDNELAGETKMTLAAKYADKASKSLKSQLLEAVEAKLQKAKPGEPFLYSIGWLECGSLNYLQVYNDSHRRFDALTNEGSKGEINAIMEAEGFKVIDSFGIPGSLRPNTTYVLER